MKVLFICKGNVGRSQMAEAFFNKFSKHKADSAGISVDENEGQIIKDIPLARLVLDSMKKEGIDVSNNVRKQVAPQMLDNYDKIIVIAEPEIIPDYLRYRKNAEFWDVKDPKGMNEKEHTKIVRQIKRLIENFIKKNNLS